MNKTNRNDMAGATGWSLGRLVTLAVPLVLLLAVLAGGGARAEEGTPLPPIPRIMGLNQYQTQVNTLLPVFSPSMLSVSSGPNWLAGKTVHQVAQAMLDSDPAIIVTGGSVVMGYDPPNGPRRIRIDYADGSVRFTNSNRSFHATSPCVAVAMSVAGSALTATAGALGVPTTEWDLTRVDTVMERGVDGEGQDPPVEPTCEIERMVTMTRKSPNGYPVFESKVRESVSNLNERARLLVDWPQFLLQTGLVMRTRTDVVTDMAQQILQAESDQTGLGAEVNLEIKLGYARTAEGYVPAARAVFADIYDRYAGVVLDVPLARNPSSGVNPAEAPVALQFRTRLDGDARIALLEFYLPRAGRVRLTVADVSGREVAVVAEEFFAAGWHQATWNLRDGTGRRVSSGVYFARLEAGAEAPSRKILVIR